MLHAKSRKFRFMTQFGEKTLILQQNVRGLYTEIMERTDPIDLMQEIRYLKGLLDANGIAYDYQAYKESQRIAEEEDEIELPELTREHAIAFYSMFWGRKDVFAKRSAKKGYFLFGRVSRPPLGQFRKEDVEGIMNIILSDGIYIDKHNLKPIRRTAVNISGN